MTKASPSVTIHAGQRTAELEKAKAVRKRDVHPQKEEHHRYLLDVLGEYDLLHRAVLDKMLELAERHSGMMELRLGLKLHHKLCKEASDKMQGHIDKYADSKFDAITDVDATLGALFPKHRQGSEA